MDHTYVQTLTERHDGKKVEGGGGIKYVFPQYEVLRNKWVFFSLW